MNKMLKRVVSILLAMILMMNAVPMASAASSNPILLKAAPLVSVAYDENITSMPQIDGTPEYAIVALNQYGNVIGYATLDDVQDDIHFIDRNYAEVTLEEGYSFKVAKLKYTNFWNGVFDNLNNYTLLESETGVLGDYKFVQSNKIKYHKT